MRVLSVNVGRIRTIEPGGKTVTTGIYKEPVSGAVRIGKEGVEGDVQANRLVHGGVDKAVLLLSTEHHEAWRRELGRDDFAAGLFGENLTVIGLPEDVVRIGDRYRIGAAGRGPVLEVTQPRRPCFKLGFKLGDEDFAKRHARSGGVGFYARVIEEGVVEAGDDIERLLTSPDAPTVLEATRHS